MRLGLRAVGSACYQVFSHLAVSFGGNLLAMLLSLPIVLVLIVVRRWSRRPAVPEAPPLDPAMRARIRREVAEREP